MTNLADTFPEYVDAFVHGTDMPMPFQKIPGDSQLTPYAALRLVTPITKLRQKGTFFTGAALASTTWRNTLSSLTNNSIVVDPACGAGDLLLPAANYAVENKLNGLTVRACDVDSDFVALALARLQTTGVEESGFIESRTQDFLKNSSSVKDATHVVLNPPFVQVSVSQKWAKGSTNLAAVFVEKVLEAMQPGAQLIAILPDVLRSGSRYERWRRRVSELGNISSVEPVGQFDKDTDIHVFVLSIMVGQANFNSHWSRTQVHEHIVSDFFDIRVGPVVPHRDPQTGDEVPFVTARSLSSGELLTRHYGGRLESGPLVLINRTSRPGQVPRARARLLTLTGNVAIENHLILAAPKKNREAACQELIRVLGNFRTTVFLDERIRCRHLTVGAVKEIPWLS